MACNAYGQCYMKLYSQWRSERVGHETTNRTFVLALPSYCLSPTNLVLLVFFSINQCSKIKQLTHFSQILKYGAFGRGQTIQQPLITTKPTTLLQIICESMIYFEVILKSTTQIQTRVLIVKSKHGVVLTGT